MQHSLVFILLLKLSHMEGNEVKVNLTSCELTIRIYTLGFFTDNRHIISVIFSHNINLNLPVYHAQNILVQLFFFIFLHLQLFQLLKGDLLLLTGETVFWKKGACSRISRHNYHHLIFIN